MMFGWLRGIAYFVPVLLLAVSPHVWGQEAVDWTADALLQDGRTIPLRFQGNSTAQPYYLSRNKSKLSQFKVEFKHPDTQKAIVWQGARYFNPVLIDFFGGTPYLVAYGRPTHDTTKLYGCPELPYVFLRHGEDGWQPIPVEQAPTELTRSNVSVYDMSSEAAGRHFSAKDIAQKIQLNVRQSSGQVQEKIPRTIADWSTDQKRNALHDRLVGDCRPPRPQQLALVMPLPTQGAAELIESVDYVPEKAYDADDWKALSPDPRPMGDCKKLFKVLDLDNYTQDLRFVNDKTQTKRVPYSRNGAFESGILQLCDDSAWFINLQEVPNKIVVTRFTSSGDLVLRAAFARPSDLPGFTGSMRPLSLHSEVGYLHFDWVYSRQIDNQWFVKRVLKMRVDAP